MRILVAGAHGQLAQALRAVAPAFQDCTLTFRGRPDFDLRDYSSLKQQISDFAPDIVINAAAHTGVDRAEAEPEETFRVNAQGAGNLARAAAAVQAAILHVSTDYVFSGESQTPYNESAPTRPINVYGHSKLAGENAVRAANPQSIVARTAWVFSPWGNNFLKTIMLLGRERDELRIVGDQFGSPTYATDLAQALLSIARVARRSGADDAVWGTYHVTNSGLASWYDLATATFAAASWHGFRQPRLINITTDEYPTRARRPRYTVLNNEKFNRVFAMPMRHWRDAVEACVEQTLPPDHLAP